MNDKDFVDGEVIHVNLKRDLISDILWRTKDRKQIRIGDMEDTHIRNCAMFLTNFGYQKCVAPEPVRLKWLHIFTIEWQRRLAARAGGNKRFTARPDKYDRMLADALDRDLDRLPGDF